MKTLLLLLAITAAVPPDLTELARQIEHFSKEGNDSARLKPFFDLYWTTKMHQQPNLSVYVGYSGVDARLSSRGGAGDGAATRRAEARHHAAPSDAAARGRAHRPRSPRRSAEESPPRAVPAHARQHPPRGARAAPARGGGRVAATGR